MKTRWMAVLLLVICLGGLQPAQVQASPAPVDPLRALAPADTIEVDVAALNISNWAPGRLIDALVAEGHGDETLFEVLGYLKLQSSGVVSDTFYNDVAAAPAGSEVFTARLNNYAALDGAVEISADGFVHITGLNGSNYAGQTGYGVQPSLDGAFRLTYALDPAHDIYTGSMQKQVGLQTITYNYKAFAIAWRKVQAIYLPMVLK